MDQFKAGLEERLECERRAVQAVQRLLNTTTPDQLCIAAAYIDPNYYADVVEERFVSSKCGYPICENMITKKYINQRYHISTKSNKVFDLSDRKKYCSSGCYKASQAYESQLPVSPVWARKEEARPAIELLDRVAIRGSIGKEVDILSDLEREVKNLALQETEPVLPSCSPAATTITHLGKHNVQETQAIPCLSETVKDKLSNSANLDNSEVKDIMHWLSEMNKQPDKIETEGGMLHNEKQQTGVLDLQPPNIVVESSDITDSVVNEPTNEVISTDKKSHSMVSVASKGKGHQDGSKQVKSSIEPKGELPDVKMKASNITGKELRQRFMRQRMNNMSGQETQSKISSVGSRRVNKQALTSDAPNNDINKKPQRHIIVLETLPQEPSSEAKSEGSSVVYNVDLVRKYLKEWTTKNTLEFIRMPNQDTLSNLESSTENSGSKFVEHKKEPAEINRVKGELPSISKLHDDTRNYTPKVNEFFGTRVVASNQQKTESDVIQFPPVDKNDQMILRRKIVLDKVNKVLPQLPEWLKKTNVSHDIRHLMGTFDLHSHNITLKPHDWKMMTACLVMMLRNRIRTSEFEVILVSEIIAAMPPSCMGQCKDLDYFVEDMLTVN